MNKLEYNDFLMFTSIFATNADMEFTQDEKELLIKMNGQESYDKTFKLFMTMNDSQRIDFIMSHESEFFNSAETKQQLLNEVMNVFNVDSEVSAAEQATFIMLRKFIS